MNCPRGVGTSPSRDRAQIGTELVHAPTKAIMAPAAEPPLWEVDANLRPEGKDGLPQLSNLRVRYYKRWAENWEFCGAFLKTDQSLGLHLGAENMRNRAVRGSQPLDLCNLQARARVTDNTSCRPAGTSNKLSWRRC